MSRSFKNFAFLVSIPVTGMALSQAYVLGQQSGTANEPATRTRTEVTQKENTNTTQRSQDQSAINKERNQNERQVQRDAVVSMDHMIVHCMNLAAQEEIAFSKFGQEKSNNKQVRAFAEQMVKEHSEVAKSLPQRYVKLMKIEEFQVVREGHEAGDHKNTLANRIAGVIDAIEGEPRAALKPVVIEEVEITSDSPLVTEQPRHENSELDLANSNVLNIQTEIAKQCLEDTKSKLSKEEGDTFDQSFVGFQIAMHQAMQSKLKVFERHASAEVKPLVEKSLKTTEKHLKQAEELMASLAHQHDSSKK